MLGRQQIAGVPTAISELFKNAHDAYAENVAVDFVRLRNLLVIRDDGTGMTPSNFEDRWLVLGTETKMRGGIARSEPPPAGMTVRPVLGEKGIGRLAIASLGPQVIVVTRSRAASDTLVALVNWTLFEAPGLNLDDLEIPTAVLRSGDPCDGAVVDGLRNRLLASIDAIPGASAVVDRAQAEIRGLVVDPAGLDQVLGEPNLEGAQRFGTQFWVSPVNESVPAALEPPFRTGPDRGTPAIQKLLLGFTDTMLPGGAAPVIKPAFRDWKTATSSEDLIAAEEFFTPEDFDVADHHISGLFDEWGRFEGTVRVYHDEPKPHVVHWPGTSPSRTECGPFGFDLAVVQGNPDDSLVDPLKWAPLTAKLNRLGGLYIYRDGIRILPYGSNDYDFLNIERRRTANAARWYFSYRRMMGVISLNGRLNQALEEKAGREGFLENKAYRQFRDILVNFFIQTTVDFFRTDGTGGRSTAFKERQAELQASAEAKKRLDRQKLARRREFDQTVTERLAELLDGSADQTVDDFLGKAAQELQTIATIQDPQEAAVALLACEAEQRDALRSIRARYQLARPRALGLSKRAVADLDAYEAEVALFVTSKLDPAVRLVTAEADEVAQQLGEAASRRKRLDATVKGQADTVRSRVRGGARDVSDDLEAAVLSVRELITATNREIQALTREAIGDAARADLAEIDEQAFEALRSRLSENLERAGVRAQGRFATLRSRLQGVIAQVADPDTDVEAADQEEVLALREREALDFELVQLGQAIAIIDHEYKATITEVRSRLRDLKPWADKNPGLDPLYRSIRTSFDHLDGYLRMFTPLQRRLGRSPVPITGREILDYLRNLFGDRLRRHSIELDVTNGFRQLSFEGVSSIFFPVFVNLLDNAIHWTSSGKAVRIIRLAAADNWISVEDSGPGLIDADLNRVFELGFSRRNGRGMGLYIARRALAEFGATIEADPDGSPLGGARFLLSLSNGESPQSDQ
jgi:signal transduction histidine kinase